MFELKNETKKRLSKFDWLDAKNSVLGSKYELSLVFCASKTSRSLNRQYREKDKPTNVLSFPNSKSSGEIFIDLETCEKEIKSLGKNKKTWVPYLYIHGLLHLSGLDHGKKMDKKEAFFVKKYSLE